MVGAVVMESYLSSAAGSTAVLQIREDVVLSDTTS